jgi:uncharacterized protein (DUF58 family)
VAQLAHHVRTTLRRSRRQRRYRVALEGWLFLLGMMLIGFAAWHSGTNLLYLMFAMLIAFFLVQGLLVWLCLLGIDVHRRVPVHPHAGEKVVVHLDVANRKRLLGSYGLRVVDRLADGHGNRKALGMAYVQRVARQGTVNANYEVTFPLRGVYSLSQTEIITRFPFGLVERGLILRRPAEILVFPQLADIAEAAAEITLDMGENLANRKGSGTDLYGLREYAEGEHARRIHWKSTAKSLRLMVMEFEREEHRKATIVLRNLVSAADANNPAVRRDFELGIVFAASLARLFVARGQEVGLTTSRGSVPAAGGQRQLARIYAALAHLELDASASTWPAENEGRTAVFEVLFRNPYVGEGDLGGERFDVRGWRLAGGRLEQVQPPTTTRGDAAA